MFAVVSACGIQAEARNIGVLRFSQNVMLFFSVGTFQNRAVQRFNP